MLMATGFTSSIFWRIIRRLKIEAESVVLAHQTLLPESGGVTLAGLDALRAELFEENYDFVAPSAYVPYLPELRDILDEVETHSDGTALGFAQAASTYIHEHFAYVKGATHVHSSVQDSLALKAGRLPGFCAPAAWSGSDAGIAGAIRLRLHGAG